MCRRDHRHVRVGDVLGRPERMWWVISAIGFLTALAMWIYNLIVKPVAAADTAGT